MMDINAKKGTKVIFLGGTIEMVRWGGNDDPREKLVEGEIYTVDHTEIHSWHTKVFLQEVEGAFNSAHFACA
ncbi:MAG: hypothetical protein KGJ90_02550 [Patescibacteria group bacterium]|nr:hypothetical protein [Patescibacteria group bacterium]